MHTFRFALVMLFLICIGKTEAQISSNQSDWMKNRNVSPEIISGIHGSHKHQ